MNRQFNILPGRAVNQAEVIRSLREKGYYSSGIPRAAVPKKKERAIRSRPSSREMRYLSEEDLKRYIEDHG